MRPGPSTASASRLSLLHEGAAARRSGLTPALILSGIMRGKRDGLNRGNSDPTAGG